MRLPSCLLIWLLILASGLVPFTAFAVQPTLPPERPPVHAPISSWRILNHRAGLIFAGRVLRIQRVPAQHLRDLETVEISFHVDSAIRGVHAGQTLTIREWAGLWVARPRYRRGERVLLFLYPPSSLGLTSPVADGRGRFGMSPDGRVRFSPVQLGWLEAPASPRSSIHDGLPLHEFLLQLRNAAGGQP